MTTASQGTVLVVDDDQATRFLVVKWLTHANLTCLEAADGIEALRILREQHEQIDLVVLDVMMPGLNGFEVLRTITADSALKLIPVLMLTAHANAETDFVEAADLGAADHLSKPFSGPVLKAKAVRAVRTRTEARDRLRQAELLARIDPLTQLGNRQLLHERLREESAFAKRYSAPLCLCLLDIDHFKSINDRFGHDTGDQALKIFARTLAASIRKEDAAFRFGGEEFVLLLRNNGRQGGLSVLARIRAALALFPLQLPENKRDSGAEYLSFSGGIAVADADNEFLTDQLIRRADIALYRAKQDGRARDCLADDSALS